VGLWSLPWQKRRRTRRSRPPRPPLRRDVRTERVKKPDQPVNYHCPVTSNWMQPKALPWVPPHNPGPTDRRQLGVRLMRSTRWFPRSTTKVACRGLPFITPAGHISTNILYTWKCNSAQFFATLCRSVLKSLLKRCNKKSRKNKLSRDAIARIALYYSIDQRESKLERLLHCEVRNVRKLLSKLISNMDDQKRFLYGQMLSSILWLQSRGRPRAQSMQKQEIPDYRGFWTFDTIRDISEELNRAGDPWIVRPVKQ
jgi:hypothetical protein